MFVGLLGHWLWTEWWHGIVDVVVIVGSHQANGATFVLGAQTWPHGPCAATEYINTHQWILSSIPLPMSSIIISGYVNYFYLYSYHFNSIYGTIYIQWKDWLQSVATSLLNIYKIRQPATVLTPNVGNHNQTKDQTMVQSSMVLWPFLVHPTGPLNTSDDKNIAEVPEACGNTFHPHYPPPHFPSCPPPHTYSQPYSGPHAGPS